jgi:membrane protein implicated in regulation of membrane protease activity
VLSLTYLVLAVLGAGYLLVSVLLGHFDFGGGGDGSGHGDAHADAGGGESHMDYGVDAGGHASASAHAPAAAVFHFPFFSPLALATLFTCIGGYGLIALYGFRVRDAASILIAIPAALVTAYVITYAGWRIVSSSRGSSQIRLQDLAGAHAEVITPIPSGGIGEVAAIISGQRFTAPAREADGREVPRGAQVTVVRMVGTTLLVKSS